MSETSPANPSTVATLAALNAPTGRPSASGFETLDQGDFLRLLTVQLQQQDPLEPVDNKDMLAQMAQFSNLAGTSEGNARLGEISAKLDALISAQEQALAGQQAMLHALRQQAAAPAAPPSPQADQGT